MATGLELAAAFRPRAVEVRLTEAVVDLPMDGGVGSSGSLVFSTNYRLGQSDTGSSCC